MFNAETAETVHPGEQSYHDPALFAGTSQADNSAQRKTFQSTESFSEKEKSHARDPEVLIKDADEEVDESRKRRQIVYRQLRPYILGGLATLILGWWISATVLKATRHRW